MRILIKLRSWGATGEGHQHSYEQSSEPVAPPESAAEVRRMLAETMAEVKAGKMDVCRDLMPQM